ncbi:MAG: TonB-dependent receptor [Phenylobacterium sp.]|nr:TonB-dependent receptor [Phenylobacterium sp.]
MRTLIIQTSAALSIGAACLAALPAHADDMSMSSDLSNLSIEDLGNIQISSVSKRAEPLSRAPAAVFVITHDDIQRSGATSLPEVLRLAPNLDVARLNTGAYTVTARGFNSPESANKLLVLVDGRSVYTPLASTVFWESQEILLADIERIEVISGPGGTLWGANAVNGVINVITRGAEATQGLLAQAGGGNHDGLLALRYGGRLGENAAFRVYGQARRSDFGGTGPLVADAPVNGLQGGFRIDGGAGPDSYTVQGDAYHNEVDLLATRLTGGNLLGRWRHQLSDDSAVQLQAYYDQAKRRYLVASDALNTFDLQLQHNLAIGERQQVVWGANYRVWKSQFNSLVLFGFAKPSKTLDLSSAFAQDDIKLTSDVTLTLGLKLENSSYSGLDYLPTARLAWQPNERTLIWSSASRAVRTPSRIDRELQGGGFAAPSPDFAAETLTAFELGYRGQPSANLSVSIAAFYNRYDDLRTASLTKGGLPIFLANQLGGTTRGVEVWGAYTVTPWWRLNFGVSTLKKNLKLDPGAIDLTHLQSAGQDPRYHALLRSQMNLGDRAALDVGLRRVGRVSPSNVPAYFEADARIGYRLTDTLEVSLAGANLLHANHLESIDPSTAPVTRIPRTVFLTLRWER